MRKILTKKMGDIFNFTLFAGDLFISFEATDSAGQTYVLGFFCDKVEANKGLFATLMSDVFSRLLKIESLRIKLIANERVLNYALNYLHKNLINNLNFKPELIQVDRHSRADLFFSITTNKIQIEKENTASFESLKKIKVLIVDDSKTIRQILQKIFSQDPLIEVIGSLENPLDVADFLKSHRPDVMTLDIHMPHIDGVTLLKQIQPKFQIPCVMISSISMEEGPLVLDALEHGAVDYIQKPDAKDIEMYTPIIIEKIKTAAVSKKVQKLSDKTSSEKFLHFDLKSGLLLIGASTGGTEAIKNVLTRLPAQIPPTLIVQHIPPVFSKAFADRMNDLCPFEVLEAVDGMEVLPNRVLIAPGGKQMKLIKNNKGFFVEVNNDPPLNRFKPSVDYLFNHIPDKTNLKLVSVLMTGMGKDGALGMLKLKNQGAITVAQDESSCVVFGMPREAIALNAAIHVTPLEKIADKIIESFKSFDNANKKEVG